MKPTAPNFSASAMQESFGGEGTILQLLPRTDFNFFVLQGGQTMKVWLAQNFDCSGYREAILSCRIHAASVTGSGGTPSCTLDLIPVAPTHDDPAPGAGGGFFRDASKLPLTLYTAASPTVPALKTNFISGPFWGLMSLQMTVVQFTTVTTHSFTISVDLNLKN